MSVNVVIKSIFDNKGIREAQKQFGQIGKDIAKVGAVAATALGVGTAIATKFTLSAVKAAEGVQQANNRLAQVNESMGLFGTSTSAVTDRLIKFAEANELSVAVDAEVIKATQAKLLTFKNLAATADDAGGSFDRATMAALDLAAAGFGSAETNAIQLGKALQDPIKGLSALRRSGITFTEQEKEQIKVLTESGQVLKAQDLILKAIETQVGGTAEATAKASDKMKLAFDNILEAGGTALLPAFEDLAQVIVDDLAPALTEVAEDVGPYLVDAMKLIAEVLKEATDSSTPLGNAIGGVKQSFELLLGAFNNGRSGVESTTDTLQQLANVLSFLITTMASFVAFLQTLGPALNALMKGDFQTFMKWLTSDPIEFQNGMKGATDALAKYKSQLGDTRVNAKKLTDQQKELAYYMKGGKPGTYNASTGGTGAGGAGSGGTKTEVETTKERFAKVQKVIKSAQAALLKAEQDYARTRFEINRDYEERVADLRNDAAKQQLALLRESAARLTLAFASATKLSLGDLFDKKTTTEIETSVKKLSSTLSVTVTKETEKTAFASVDAIVKGLQDRLAASRKLLENASKLSSEGFSQTFIEQVIETGAETGNALADAILSASPETKSQLKQLFGDLETVSETGMDALANQITEKFGLATRELRAQSVAIQAELNDAIIAENKRLATALADAGYAFGLAISDIKSKFLSDLDGFNGWFAGLGSTIDALLSKMGQLSGKALTDTQKAITAPTAGTALAGATIQQDVAIKNIKNAQGIVIDSMNDIAGTAAYIQARINAANTYIKSSSSNAAQELSAAAQIANWTKELSNLQGAAATGSAAGTVVNINVKTDTTQSQAMVGKTIGNIVTKYVTTGGQVLVSGNR